MSIGQRRVRIDLAYDGTDFAGWQLQRRARTVQGVVEEALGRLEGGAVVRLRAAGRTDAGVHARGQVADALCRARMDDVELCSALGAILPVDVRPLAVRSVPESFHAQRDARGKIYRYRLDLSRHGDPLSARYALHHPAPLDVERMRAALTLLPGRHDFGGFTSTACTVRDRVRTLAEASFTLVDAETARFTFAADGFLRYMVRNLVGTLLCIGRRRMEPERIERILATADRQAAGPTAPAHGLCLEAVLY